MTRHLISAGHRLHVGSRGRGPIDAALAAGAIDDGDPAFVAAHSEIVLLCVPFTPDVTRVLTDLAPGLRSGTVVVDHSTIDAAAEPGHRDLVVAAGGRYVEAPVSGGPAAARAGALAIYAGGEVADIEAVHEVLAAYSARVVHTGPTGSGQTMRLCNNLVHAAQNLAVAEAFGLAARAGLDPRALHEVVLGSTGDCTAVRQRVPVTGVVPDSPASNDWRGFPVEWMKEEMDMVLRLADSHDFPLVSTRVFRRLLDFAADAGYGDLDFSAIGRLYQESDRRTLRWCANTAATLESPAG
ncbi:NAD(P)-dependent oxidoreductase [Actinophytocola oryzae]|uniref:3-hydroxyisobutyrate dehydrogenase n=1 Tax=Actinophytocola oryzae TaxID=502181 RepID=A0A4R7W1N1_9PSEU|nr:NAD(P)-dependent oxidoreductase [Actinophytocola oryzae]TDV56384.1 3-hydroxyisobutyrate dehydrogenase [Actinophytocola oryzae]